MLEHINVKEDILKDEKYDYLFSVEKINELVMSGASFREAYREVRNSFEMIISLGLIRDISAMSSPKVVCCT